MLIVENAMYPDDGFILPFNILVVMYLFTPTHSILVSLFPLAFRVSGTYVMMYVSEVQDD